MQDKKDPYLFESVIGKFESLEERENIDKIKDFIFKKYEKEIKDRPSMHTYIDSLPKEEYELFKPIFNNKKIRDQICSKFDDCNIIHLKNTDEIYISHYNIDKGGDQGLFEKHYDGVLKDLKDSTIVRLLVYVNANDDYKVHFLDSNVSHNFKTYEYGLLDFNREYHYVEGSYNKNDTPRVLLKINYLVCPHCTPFYQNFVIKFNTLVFYIVKTSMEYSKSPKNIFQKIIGFFCNFFRIFNSYNPLLAILTFLLIVFLIFYLVIKLIYYVYLQLKNSFNKFTNKSVIKKSKMKISKIKKFRK